MRKRILTILMTVVVTLSFVPMLEGNVAYAFEDTGNAVFNSFINDNRYTEGVSWSNCYSYVQAFTSYCFGNNNPKAGTQFSSTSEIRAGDVIWINSTHYFAVLKRSGDSLYIAEGNHNGKVSIGWNYLIVGSYIRAIWGNAEPFVGWHFGSATPTAQLRIDRSNYNTGDTINFYFSGENTSGRYTLGIYKNGVRWKSVEVNGNTYSLKINEADKYSAYMTSYGTYSGYADSNWVNWTVYHLTANLSADKTKCNTNDQVTLRFSGNNSNTFAGQYVTLAVWCNEEYVVHKNVTERSFAVNCDKPGHYKSYMTAYGGGALKDSNWVEWDVYPVTAELTANKTKCNVNDQVTLSFSGNNSNAFANDKITLAVWYNGEYVVHKNVTDKKYVVTCDKPGEYTSYMTAYGGGTYKDSNWVKWTVYPLTAELSVNKKECKTGETVKLSFGGDNSNAFESGYVTLAVWCNGKYVVHKDVYSRSFELKCSEPGEYTSYMTAYGGGTYKDSNWVKWIVTPNSTGNPDTPSKPSSTTAVNPANGASEGASAAAVTKYLTTRQDDSDAPGSTYGKLTARVSKAGKTSQKVVWNAVPGAVKYNLYANKCGKTNKLIFFGSVTGTSFNHKGLKKGTYYKYMVVAVDKNERVAASSKVVHSATAGGKVGNFKKVKTAAKKNKVNLKTGKKFKLKAKGVKGKGKVKKHRGICYESSNPAVATVSKKGIIKGVAPGKCIVYAYAQNGVFAKVKISIK